MGTQIPTDYLVATPSFLTGAGSVFNLAGGYFRYNTSSSPASADASAIRRDWLSVAADLREAMKQSKAEVARAAR